MFEGQEFENNVFPNTRILPKIKKNMLTSPKMVSNEKLHIGNNKKSTQKTILWWIHLEMYSRMTKNYKGKGSEKKSGKSVVFCQDPLEP